jgi:CO dehydrogenase/acetyl-CoA synthase alpha subunit
MGKKKRRTRRGGRASNTSKGESIRKENEQEQRREDEESFSHQVPHCDELGHLALECPNKLENKAQANDKRQDSVK